MEVITADIQETRAIRVREKLAAYYDLTKPRITFLVVLSSLAGFTLGSPSPINWLLFLHTTLGIALLSSGISALNQYWERDLDALMERTRTRSLPAGKLTARSALVFGARGAVARPGDAGPDAGSGPHQQHA